MYRKKDAGMIKICIWLFLMVFSWQHTLAQDSLRLVVERHVGEYMGAVSKYAALFSGNRQLPLVFTTKNHQYFKEEEYTSGRLSYCGIVYPDVSLRWDLYRDELVLFSPANYNIVLINENLDFAEIYGYHIFYLQPDGLLGCPPAGNYIRLYSGEFLLLEKLTNELLQKEEANRIYYYFSLKTNFYLQKDGMYYKIKNRRKLLKTLDTHRKELRRFIRVNDLGYRRDAEKLVLEVVKEHEKLNR